MYWRDASLYTLDYGMHFYNTLDFVLEGCISILDYVLEGCISLHIRLCIERMHLYYTLDYVLEGCISTIHYTMYWRDASLQYIRLCIGGMHLSTIH